MPHSPSNFPFTPPPEDPVGENPCPVGHPAHKIWADATAQALAEHFRLNQEMLERTSAREGLPGWLIELCFRRFQIWARRNFSIVRNRPAAVGYSQWLDNYIEAIMVTACEREPGIEVELRSELARAANYWKANAYEQIGSAAKPSHKDVMKDETADEFSFFKEARPLGDNPFARGHVLWSGFEAATFETKKELDLIWAKYGERHKSIKTPAEMLALILTARFTRVDMIAAFMLRAIVVDGDTAQRYEDWLGEFLRSEKKVVLDLVHTEKPEYGILFNEENFTHELVLKQQQYKEKCDSQAARSLRHGLTPGSDDESMGSTTAQPEARGKINGLDQVSRSPRDLVDSKKMGPAAAFLRKVRRESRH